MHKEILKPPSGFETDHINHNGLDNRKDNLRICTTSQNHYNQIIRSESKTSKFKGVSRHKASRKWIAQIGYGRRMIYLGCFDSESEAARAYNQKARELFGEFANLNPTHLGE